LQLGVLNADGRENFKLAQSYFAEAFQQFDAAGDPRAIKALKYVMLSQLVRGHPQEVLVQAEDQMTLKYVGRDIDAMKYLAMACKEGSLTEFKKVVNDYPKELHGDNVVGKTIDGMYNDMMEENLRRLVRPYSKVQTSHIAQKIDLPKEDVEKRLCKMILDHKLDGVLDVHGEEQVFIAHNEEEGNEVARNAAITFRLMSDSVNTLALKANRLLK